MLTYTRKHPLQKNHKIIWVDRMGHLAAGMVGSWVVMEAGMKLMYGLNSIDFNSPRLIQPLHCCMPQTVNTRDQAHLISVVQFFLEPKQPLNDKLTGTFYTVRGMDSSQGGLTKFTVAFPFLPSGPWPAEQGAYREYLAHRHRIPHSITSD